MGDDKIQKTEGAACSRFLLYKIQSMSCLTRLVDETQEKIHAADHCITSSHGDSHTIEEMRSTGFKDREIRNMLLFGDASPISGDSLIGYTYVSLEVPIVDTVR